MGVWIETMAYQKSIAERRVTPFVGVWIETTRLWLMQRTEAVTPFVGVWIETLMPSTHYIWDASHTLRGCVD